MINKKRKILFIDDDKMCHTLIDLIIPEVTDYELISAFNGKDAVELAKKHAHEISFVIADIMLPGLDGYEIFDIFRRDETLSKKPFVFQSGYVWQKEFVEQNLASRMIILSKPYTQEDLLKVIAEVEAIIESDERQ